MVCDLSLSSSCSYSVHLCLFHLVPLVWFPFCHGIGHYPPSAGRWQILYRIVRVERNIINVRLKSQCCETIATKFKCKSPILFWRKGRFENGSPFVAPLWLVLPLLSSLPMISSTPLLFPIIAALDSIVGSRSWDHGILGIVMCNCTLCSHHSSLWTDAKEQSRLYTGLYLWWFLLQPALIFHVLPLLGVDGLVYLVVLQRISTTTPRLLSQARWP